MRVNLTTAQLIKILFFVSLAIIATALASQYIGGLRPCELCLQQRWAYYANLILLALPTLLRLSRPLITQLLALVALIFLANAGLGMYHAGIEYGFWAGPQGCSGAGGGIAVTVDDLLDQLAHETPASCNAPAFLLWGISMAGYNVIASLGLASISLWTLFRNRKHAES